MATILIPVMLHRASRKTEEASRINEKHMRQLESELVQIASATRRQQLIPALESEKCASHFASLIEEVESRYTGRDLADLRKVYRKNPLQPLPRPLHLLEEEVDDCIAGLEGRFAETSPNWQGKEIINFAAAVSRITDRPPYWGQSPTRSIRRD